MNLHCSNFREVSISLCFRRALICRWTSQCDSAWVIKNYPRYATKIMHKNFDDKFYSKVGSQDDIRLEAKFTHDSLFSEIREAFQSLTK